MQMDDVQHGFAQFFWVNSKETQHLQAHLFHLGKSEGKKLN